MTKKYSVHTKIQVKIIILIMKILEQIDSIFGTANVVEL